MPASMPSSAPGLRLRSMPCHACSDTQLPSPSPPMQSKTRCLGPDACIHAFALWKFRLGRSQEKGGARNTPPCTQLCAAQVFWIATPEFVDDIDALGLAQKSAPTTTVISATAIGYHRPA